VPPHVPDHPAAKGLQQDHDVDGDTDPVVRVRQRPLWPDGEESEDEDDGAEPNGEDVEVGVRPHVALVVARAAEALDHHGRGHEDEEGDRRQHAVGGYEAVVLRQGREAVAHAYFPSERFSG
jgi:hypothetical protein